MVGKFHGIFSLTLLLVAIAIAIACLFSFSIGWGLVYLAVIGVANPVVMYAYCAKCLCREDACSHVLPGKLTRLLPTRKQGPYVPGDYLATGLSLVAMFGFPQIWLWQSKGLFVGFWILIAIGLADIFFFVCRSCSNTNCPNCYKKIQTSI